MFFLHLAKSAADVHLTAMLPSGFLSSLSEKRLVNTLLHAFAHVPFYNQIFSKAGMIPERLTSASDLKKLPFTTKKEIREAFPDRIMADTYNIENCHYSATTGSTGRSLPFVYSMPTFAYYLATNLRVYTRIGYKPWYRCSYIKYTPMDPCNIGPFFRFDHIPSIMPVEEQIEMLKKNRPHFIDGYASILFEIAKRMTPSDFAVIRPNMILLNSELSTQHERDFISSVFSCPVYDEYSTEETWMIASTCKQGHYHLYTDNVWIEVLDENGNDVPPGTPGEIVLTTLRSPAMPFIRYRIGDRGCIGTRARECGSPFPVLESFEGRDDDHFILPDGTMVSSLKILNTFTMFINKYLHLIDAFQVIQHAPHDVEIELVRGNDYNDSQFGEVIAALSNLLGMDVTIRVTQVNAIRSNGGIKRKAIVSRVSPESVDTQTKSPYKKTA